MLSTFRPPLPPLRRYISMLWLVDGYVAAHTRERALPNGHIGLVINLGDDRWSVYAQDDLTRATRLSGSLVGGATDRYAILDPREQGASMGAQFTATGAAALLGLPAHELTDRDVGLADLWGDRAQALRERLINLPSPEARLDELEAALLQRAQRGRVIDIAVVHAARRLDVETGVTVRAVAREIGVSEQRLIRQFRDAVGLTPKRYARVRRFQSAMQRIGAGLSIDWPQLAVDCGFYDQAHLINEFRAFAGATPTEVARGDPERMSHFVIE